MPGLVLTTCGNSYCVLLIKTLRPKKQLKSNYTMHYCVVEGSFTREDNERTLRVNLTNDASSPELLPGALYIVKSKIVHKGNHSVTREQQFSSVQLRTFLCHFNFNIYINVSNSLIVNQVNQKTIYRKLTDVKWNLSWQPYRQLGQKDFICDN